MDEEKRDYYGREVHLARREHLLCRGETKIPPRWDILDEDAKELDRHIGERLVTLATAEYAKILTEMVARGQEVEQHMTQKQNSGLGVGIGLVGCGIVLWIFPHVAGLAGGSAAICYALGLVILLDGLFQSVPEEQRNALLDANVFDCPGGCGKMVQVQPTDRIQLRSATDEPKTNSVDDLLKSVFEKPEEQAE